MTKKTYLRPTANVVEVRIAQMVCTSLNNVASTGLDDNESLDYGDGNTTEKDAWGNAW
jgi:hypothetical protein